MTRQGRSTSGHGEKVGRELFKQPLNLIEPGSKPVMFPDSVIVP